MTIKKWYDHTEAKKALEEFNPDVNIDLYRQSGLYAWWNSLLVQAELQLDKINNRMEVVEATLDKEVREDAAKSGTKMTEGQIRSKITLHPTMITIRGMAIEAKAEVGYLKGVCFGLKQRLDALLQISRNMAIEMRDATVAGHIREDRNDRVRKILEGVRPTEFTNYEE